MGTPPWLDASMMVSHDGWSMIKSKAWLAMMVALGLVGGFVDG